MDISINRLCLSSLSCQIKLGWVQSNHNGQCPKNTVLLALSIAEVTGMWRCKRQENSFSQSLLKEHSAANTWLYCVSDSGFQNCKIINVCYLCHWVWDFCFCSNHTKLIQVLLWRMKAEISCYFCCSNFWKFPCHVLRC